MDARTMKKIVKFEAMSEYEARISDKSYTELKNHVGWILEMDLDKVTEATLKRFERVVAELWREADSKYPVDLPQPDYGS